MSSSQSSTSSHVWHQDRYYVLQVSGMREYLTQDGVAYWTRKRGTNGAWESYQAETTVQVPKEEPMRLLLVRQRQAEGEPRHWSLFLSRENQAGTVYQVKGDATYMRFDHAANVNILNSTSLLDSYIICDYDREQYSLAPANSAGGVTAKCTQSPRSEGELSRVDSTCLE